MLDTLIRGATVFDGLRTEPQRLTIGIRGEHRPKRLSQTPRGLRMGTEMPRLPSTMIRGHR